MANVDKPQMIIKNRFLLILILVSCVCTEKSVAQEEERMYRIVTTDNQTFIGTLVAEDDLKVTIQTETAGRITIERKNIVSLAALDSDRIRNGKYWYENPQSTRYFFAPNAIGMRKGNGYYQNTWVLFNNVNYGITDNISIGGGIVPLFLFGSPVTPVWLLPKVSIPVSEGQFYLGAGAMIGGLIGVETDPLGVFYGVGTLGNRDKNLTVGLGYGYAGNEVSSTPLVNISGSIRISRRMYLLSESYFLPGTESNGLVSFGMRWASESFAIDFGLFRPLEDAAGLIGVPWLGVTLPFGR